jgi:hypothetical protein
VTTLAQTSTEIDLARGLLTANARRAGALVPVHVLQLASEFRRRHVPSEYSALLRSLHLLREAQPLSRGLWVPAPTSIVEHPRVALAISGNPSSDLRELCSIEPLPFGFARRCLDSAGSFPKVPWAQWLQVPTDTAEWAKQHIKDCLRVATPATSEQSLQIYRHWSGAGSRWCAIGEVPQNLFLNVAMCKGGGGSAPATYYLCELRTRRLCGVAEIPSELNFRFRLQIALAALNSSPDRFFVRHVGPVVEIHCRPLPESEKRMLLALGEFDESSNPWKTTTSEELFPIMQNVLMQLGLEERIV